jgi:D-sedoheptulose 7-phosphate isomerase
MKNVEQIFNDFLERYPSLSELSDNIMSAYDLICDSYDNGGKVLACGNGGSAADSDHIVGELMKGFISKRKLSREEMDIFEGIDGAEHLISNLQGALPAISLCSHSALMTAFLNDVEPDMIFAQQVWGYSKNSFDTVIALSTSGNSADVVNAVKVANALGINSIGITGADESALSELCTVCIRLPETETFKVQELTLPVYHLICEMVEATYFD